MNKRKNILVFAGLYPNKGTGNVLRMMALCDFILQHNENVTITFCSNEINVITQNFPISRRFKTLSPHEDFGAYDTGLYDSPEHDLHILKKMDAAARNGIIAFDFFEYHCPFVATIINLYNHFPQNLHKFKGKAYKGLDYAIIKDSLLTFRPKKSDKKEHFSALISFGGEDPSNHTLKAIEACLRLKIPTRVIVGKLNRNRQLINKKFSHHLTILDHIDTIEEEYDSCELVICGGGTTMLEAIYFQKYIVAIPQNGLEESFVNSLIKSQSVYLFKEMDHLVTQIRDGSAIGSTQRGVDGLGKKRIMEIILEP